MAETTKRSAKPQVAVDTEIATRLRDPFETLYMGLVRSNDPLLLEKGGASSGAELYLDLKRDGKVFASLQKRILAQIGRPFQVTPVKQGAHSPCTSSVCACGTKPSARARSSSAATTCMSSSSTALWQESQIRKGTECWSLLGWWQATNALTDCSLWMKPLASRKSSAR